MRPTPRDLDALPASDAENVYGLLDTKPSRSSGLATATGRSSPTRYPFKGSRMVRDAIADVAAVAYAQLVVLTFTAVHAPGPSLLPTSCDAHSVGCSCGAANHAAVLHIDLGHVNPPSRHDGIGTRPPGLRSAKSLDLCPSMSMVPPRQGFPHGGLLQREAALSRNYWRLMASQGFYSILFDVRI